MIFTGQWFRKEVLALIMIMVGVMAAAEFSMAQPPPARSQSDPLEEGWVLAYANDFSKPGLDTTWVITSGSAVVAEGVLALRADSGDAQVVLRDPCFLSPAVRVVVEAYAVDSARLSDLSVFLNAPLAHSSCDGAYLFQFGAEHNTVNRLRRLGEIIDKTIEVETRLTAARPCLIEATNDAGNIRLAVDGKTIFDWQDPKPLSGPAHCHVGFYTWESEVHVQSIKIYHRVPKAKGRE